MTLGLYNTFRQWCCALPGGTVGITVALLLSWAVVHSLPREEGIVELEFNIVFCGLGG